MNAQGHALRDTERAVAALVPKLWSVDLQNTRLRSEDFSHQLSRAKLRHVEAKIAKRHLPLTQSFVARELDISQSFLSKIEQGLQEPNFLLVERLATYYGVKLSVLETNTQEEKKCGHRLNDH